MAARRKEYDENELALDVERGMCLTSVARKHGISYSHLLAMVHGRSRPEFARKLARARAQLQADIRRRLRGLQTAAVDTLRRAMREDEEDAPTTDSTAKTKSKRTRRAPVSPTALAAAKEVLNRCLPEEANEPDRPTLVDLLPGLARLTPETLALVDRELDMQAA